VRSRVLIVEDEPRIARALGALLRVDGHEPEHASSVAQALEAALLRPDAVLLDLLLPDGSGLEFCRRLREWSQAPILVVSAVGDEREKITALDAGADDYVTKPYAPGELLARLRAVMRRSVAPPGESAVVAFGDVEVDLEHREVRWGGDLVPLTAHEYGLLAELARRPDRVLTHHALLEAVWGPGSTAQTHYLRVYMRRLRAKLEADPTRPRHLVTETGVGYRLRRDVTSRI
jgi:two-component system KDP operon response regulator KdpE